MHLPPTCSLLAAALLLATVPAAAGAQWQPSSRFGSAGAVLDHAGRAPNYERRRVIVAGMRHGALLGMMAGAVVGVVDAQVRDDSYGAAFTVIGWMTGGLVGGGAVGGLRAARRYDARQGQPSNVALHLTGSHPTFSPLAGLCLGTHRPACMAPAGELGR